MGGGQAYRTGFEGLVLAAGAGTRFGGENGSQIPKVLHPLLQKPMIEYVLDALEAAGIHEITVVVGFMARQVQQAIGGRVRYVTQEERNGSGHAVACARERFADFGGHLVVMCGDSPLFRPRTVTRMMRRHVSSGAVMTLASAALPDPTGYGRIVCDGSGAVRGVVEECCASDEQRQIREVNGGAYVFDARWLFANIDQIGLNNAGEYNLTDMARVATAQNRVVAALECSPKEILGINAPLDAAAAERILRRRLRPWKNPEVIDETHDHDQKKDYAE